MNAIKRFFVELFHPAKKCERVGHKLEQDTSIWVASPEKAKKVLIQEPLSFGYPVAHQLSKTVTKCSRCKVVLKTRWEHRHSINTLTYETGGEFDKNGMVRVG